MAWIINFAMDADKTSVGTASAVFTDSDATVFSYSRRTDTTAPNFQSFVQAAIAAKNAWKALKTNEGVAITNLVAGFIGGGESATGGTPT